MAERKRHRSSTATDGGGKADRKMNPGDEALPGTPGTGEDTCPLCQGDGRLDGVFCPNCGGTGRIVRAIGGA